MKRLLVALVAWLALLGGRADARPRLDPVSRSGRISVVAEPGLEDLAVRLGSTAESTLARIAGDLTDLPQPRRITIQLVRDAADLASIAPEGRGAPPWAIGVAYPDLGVISIATRRGANAVDPASTLRHELAHIALGAAIGDKAPHWLHEGFAYQHSGEWSWDRTETLAGMSWMGSVVPLDDLDRSFPAEELPANRAYAESYDFVGYLSRRGRWEDGTDAGDRWPFRKWLSSIGHGESLDAASVKAYGKPLHALFAEWQSDLDKRYMFMPIGLLGLAVWILCGFLLFVAWFRRRRQNRRRLAQWDFEERARAQAIDEEARSALVIVPPYIAWPGEDPLSEPTEHPDDDPKPDPSQLN